MKLDWAKWSWWGLMATVIGEGLLFGYVAYFCLKSMLGYFWALESFCLALFCLGIGIWGFFLEFGDWQRIRVWSNLVSRIVIPAWLGLMGMGFASFFGYHAFENWRLGTRYAFGPGILAFVFLGTSTVCFGIPWSHRDEV